MARRFANWARTVVTKPSAWFSPASEAEVVDVIRGAAGKRVRVVGGGHSWSAIAAPEQIGMTLDKLTGIVDLDEPDRVAVPHRDDALDKLTGIVDPAEPDRVPAPHRDEVGVVTVRAGTRLRDLNSELAERGLALPILGSIAEQSVAGAIATGTHGSSLVHGNLATLVERMKLVDGRGQIVELTGEKLDAARVHLGALGVVTEVALKVLPAFRLAETVERIPLDVLPTALASIASSAEYVKVWWMPHTRSAYIFRYERTEDAATTKPNLVRQRWIDDNIMHGWVFPAVLRIGRLPGLTPRISRLVAGTFMRPRCVGPSPLMFSTPMPVRHRETEAAMPMTIAGEAVDRVVRVVERERLIVNFILEIRFVRGDTGWMSPAYGADTCQIGAYCFGSRSTAYFAAFWREMRELGARPHWGKELDHTADEVRALWPMTSRFVALRDELDPDRVFASEFHARVLGA